ncbi:MAG: hypothetical protein JWL72_1314 [Ilumatobacteraceae bacterium]|nr:hypothetical protein [Ilumatobacteraceae bacterium]
MRSFRLVHVGVAAALAAAAVTAVGLVESVTAAGSTSSVFTPIVPCRLADTRPAPDNVGVRSTPIAAGETVTFQVTGTNGRCTIPADATGIVANATAVNATAASFVTFWPSDAALPLASNLNVTAGSAPTPNQVTVALSAGGAVNAFNLAGTVDVLIDIVGYDEPGSGGGKGDKGDKGDTGPAGPACPATGCVLYVPASSAFQRSPATILTDGCVLEATIAILGLPLPEGAILQDVAVRYYDEDAGNGAANSSSAILLRGRAGSHGGVTASSAVKTADDDHDIDLILNTFATAPVEGPDQYVVEFGAGGPTQYFCGVKVTYGF